MRMQIPMTALGLALVAGAPAANAQTLITRQVTDQPIETVVTQQPSGTLVAQEPLVAVPSGTLVSQPVQTVRTVETVRTVRPVTRTVVRHQIVTTRRTVTRERLIPAPTVVARTTVYPRPLYDHVGPVAVAPAPYSPPLYDTTDVPMAAGPAYPRPLYDAVVPASDDSYVGVADVAPPVVSPSSTSVSFYRYVYEPDRILVIDPSTNIAVQAIPR